VVFGEFHKSKIRKEAKIGIFHELVDCKYKICWWKTPTKAKAINLS